VVVHNAEGLARRRSEQALHHNQRRRQQLLAFTAAAPATVGDGQGRAGHFYHLRHPRRRHEPRRRRRRRGGGGGGGGGRERGGGCTTSPLARRVQVHAHVVKEATYACRAAASPPAASAAAPMPTLQLSVRVARWGWGSEVSGGTLTQERACHRSNKSNHVRDALHSAA